MSFFQKALAVGLLCLFASWANAAEADKPLTNADVLALLEAGLDADLIVAKIQQAPIAQLDVSTEELIRLSKKDVPKKVVNAMIARMNRNDPFKGGTTNPGLEYMKAQGYIAAKASRVELVDGSEKFEISKKNGEISSAGFLVFATVWLNIPDRKASVRTTQSTPTIRVFRENTKDLAIVSLEENRRDRSLQLPFGPNRSVHSVGIEPHPESVVTREFVETSPGVWDAKFVKPLPKGEYAVFENGLYMYDFGVDDQK